MSGFIIIAGDTDDKGKMLVPKLNTVCSDDENLPLNTEFEEIALKVAPRTKSAVLLDFNIKIIKSIEMTVFDSK
ncbi:hypothetical protein [Rickettsia honei]|uniref:hypothetical protein n=1 Tax=Rickettsia honei TaxID=37816 RepID=UPI0002D99EA2|nr:hypothetical protein [Rickettsia honei]